MYLSVVKEIEIVYSGELAEIDNLEILTRTVIQGAVNPFLSSPVNAVNASLVAKDRGISITEGRKDNAKGYDSLIKVIAKSSDDVFSAEGTHLHEARILKVNDYWVDVIPEGHMFIAKYEDVPGSILHLREVATDFDSDSQCRVWNRAVLYP